MGENRKDLKDRVGRSATHISLCIASIIICTYYVHFIKLLLSSKLIVQKNC